MPRQSSKKNYTSALSVFTVSFFLEELWKSHALWNVRMFYHVRSHTTNILVGLPLVELMTKERIQHGPKEKL